MMSRSLFKAIWAGLAFLTLPILASAAGYTALFKITEYHLDLNGSAWNLWIKPDQAVVNPDGCSSTGFYVLPMDYAYSKERYSAILLAFAAGKSIEVYVNGCYSGYPLVDQSRLRVAD
jgi:hypothetical protein